MNHAPYSTNSPPGHIQAILACVLAVLALWLAQPAMAGTAEGIAAYKLGNYERAYAELKPEAEAGDAEAQLHIGRIHTYGYIGAPNADLAFQWYLKAANGGLAEAQAIVGYAYDRGIGVGLDDGKAIEWYQKAASEGNESAQRNLGLMYKEGEGVDRDYQKAATWFRKAAEQEDAVAQNELCGLYYDGFGVPHDYRRAAYWCRRAAENGNAHAQYTLQGLILQGLGSGGGAVSAYAWALYAARQDFPGGKQAWKNRRMFLSESQEHKVVDLVDANQWPNFPRFSSEEEQQLRQRGEGEIRILH